MYFGSWQSTADVSNGAIWIAELVSLEGLIETVPLIVWDR
jgi:hypothetical protein